MRLVFFSWMDYRFINISNYRQASAVAVAVAAAAAAAGHFSADDTNGLPHQPVHRHVTVGCPRPPNPFGDASAVGRRFR